MNYFEVKDLTRKIVELVESREFPKDYTGTNQKVFVDGKLLHDLYCDLQFQGKVLPKWRKKVRD